MKSNPVSSDERCKGECFEAYTDTACPVHGNHPSNIEPLTDIGDCDNRRQNGRDLDDC